MKPGKENIKNNKPVIGLCIPPRPVEGEAPALWGCLKPGIRAPLLERLSDDPVYRFVEADFRHAIIRNGKLYTANRCLNELDAYFWYCEVDRKPGSYHLELLKLLARDIPVIPDPVLWEQAMDKFTAHEALRKAGIAVPETVLADLRNLNSLQEVLQQWEAAMLKPRRGGWGSGVTLISEFSTLRDVAGYLENMSPESLSQGFYLERYYDNDPAQFASITLLGGEVMYGYRKPPEKFVDLGNGRLKVLETELARAEALWTPLNETQLGIAEAAAAVLQCPVIGFDLICTPDGYLIVDENTSPGNYPAVYEKAGIDPAETFGRMILTQLGNRLD
jgi:glutathione synthase/RimK-type ligase-like ATP-grasp enzyme